MSSTASRLTKKDKLRKIIQERVLNLNATPASKHGGSHDSHHDELMKSYQRLKISNAFNKSKNLVAEEALALGNEIKILHKYKASRKLKRQTFMRQKTQKQ